MYQYQQRQYLKHTSTVSLSTETYQLQFNKIKLEKTTIKVIVGNIYMIYKENTGIAKLCEPKALVIVLKENSRRKQSSERPRLYWVNQKNQDKQKHLCLDVWSKKAL